MAEKTRQGVLRDSHGGKNQLAYPYSTNGTVLKCEVNLLSSDHPNNEFKECLNDFVSDIEEKSTDCTYSVRKCHLIAIISEPSSIRLFKYETKFCRL